MTMNNSLQFTPKNHEFDPRLTSATILFTAGVHAKISQNIMFFQEVLAAITKFEKLDWGDTCKADADLNASCLAANDRLFAVYNTCEGKIYIIADAPPAHKPYETITVLFPSEY